MNIERYEGGSWIKNAVNPKHKGYCTPMTKSTCTPRRKAFARRAKAHFKQEGGISIDGYKPYSPDRYRDFNIIPSGNITMKGVDFPVFGEADTGERKLMMPGGEYEFSSARYVKETPLRKAQQGLSFTDQAISPSGDFFEPQNNYVSTLDYDREKMISEIPKMPYTEGRNTTVNFNDFLHAIPGVSATLAGIATQVDNKRKTNDMMSKLNNPLSVLPYDNNTNDYYTKGTATYQEGGEFEEEEEDFNSFLWDVEEEAPTQAPQQVEPEQVVEEEAPPEEGVMDYSSPTFDDGDGEKSFDFYGGDFGGSADTLRDSIATSESGGDYKAVNPNSSAVGKYQFLWSYYKDPIKKVTGVTSKEEFRNNPQAQEEFWEYYRDNQLLPDVQMVKQYNSKGLSDMELAKLIHFKGRAGAIRWLTEGIDDTTKNNIPIEQYIKIK